MEKIYEASSFIVVAVWCQLKVRAKSAPPLRELGLRVVQKQLLLTILMNYKFVNGLARILEKSGLNADEFNEGIRIEPKIPDFWNSAYG